MIRPAALDDLDPLVRLEQRCFDSDRLSRRSFRYLLGRGSATLLVDTENNTLRGYVLVLFRTGTSLARLYSIAVAPEHRGGGIARALLENAETISRERGCIAMRLEIRSDNAAAERLYRKMGYRPFGTYPDYYEDHAEALRMEKSLVAHLKPATTRVPYYEQTLDFTCGPAAIIMAMQALDPTLVAGRKLEIRLWREATTVFMTSGHGGCGPYGMALSAWRRGFDVQVFLDDASALFVDSVRNTEKKEVIRLAQEDFLDEIRATSIQLHYNALSLDAMQRQFEAGGIPVVLISSYRIYREKFPHWVTVTGFDKHFIYVHDPYVEYDQHKAPLDSINMPIPKREFERMARYGKAARRAALVIRKRVE